jgi:hypothetical protein
MYDIYGMQHCPFWQTTPFYCLMAFVAMVLLFSGYYVLVARRRKAVVKTAWQTAMHDLKVLERQQITENIGAQELYLRLTATMKRYLQDRYGYLAVSKTDAELLALLPTTSFPKELIPGLETLFRGSVEVKFARGSALATQVKQDLTYAVLVVQTTQPRD